MPPPNPFRVKLRFVDARWTSRPGNVCSCDACKERQARGENLEPREIWTASYHLLDGTPTELQFGDLYFSRDHRGIYDCPWTNCDGTHLYAIIPASYGQHRWDIDSRASNCTMKDNRTHRCWRRTGDPRVSPPNLHVDKSGRMNIDTCSAGAGSIGVDGWHGFIHHGELHT